LTGGYDLDEVAKYWTKRLRSTDPLAAVLSYDAPTEANRAYDRWERESLLRQLPPTLRQKRALDIGCGTGRITLLLAKLGARVTGVDISQAMLDRCMQRATRLRVKSRIGMLLAAAHAIPCATSNFHFVTCFGLLEHLPPRHRRMCISESARVLAPGGRFYAVVNNEHNPFLKSEYRRRRPPMPGHRSDLVGIDWLKRTCARLSLRATPCAANPFYGLAHFAVWPRRQRLKLTRSEAEALFELATDLDLQHALPDALIRRFASHYLVMIRRCRSS
jgi:ubiquinone/menaquinone biosynthesis C-methylase UbiE